MLKQIAEQTATIETMKQKTKDFVQKLKLDNLNAYNALNGQYKHEVEIGKATDLQNAELKEQIVSLRKELAGKFRHSSGIRRDKTMTALYC
jgi:uncharacterized protein (DUF885 family)